MSNLFENIKQSAISKVKSSIDGTMGELETARDTLAVRRTALAKREKFLDERGSKLEKQRAALEKKRASLLGTAEQLEETKELLDDRAQTLDEREKRLERDREQIEERELAVKRREKQLGLKTEAVATLVSKANDLRAFTSTFTTYLENFLDGEPDGSKVVDLFSVTEQDSVALETVDPDAISRRCRQVLAIAQHKRISTGHEVFALSNADIRKYGIPNGTISSTFNKLRSDDLLTTRFEPSNEQCRYVTLKKALPADYEKYLPKGRREQNG